LVLFSKKIQKNALGNLFAGLIAGESVSGGSEEALASNGQINIADCVNRDGLFTICFFLLGNQSLRKWMGECH